MKKEWTKFAVRCLAFLLAVSLAVPPVHVSAYETEPGAIGMDAGAQPGNEEADPTGIPTEGPTEEPTGEPTEEPTKPPVPVVASEDQLDGATPPSNVKEYVAGGVLCTLTEDGVFTISKIDNPESGTAGVMCDYATNDDMPWYAESIRLSIKTLIVEEGVTVLGERIFNNASNLESISLPSTLEVIGPRCFSNCKGLTKISIPDRVKKIGDTAFNGCTNLTEVDLSNTRITELGSKIFSACSNLTTITLPKITKIGASCFGSSSGVSTGNLTRVNFKGTASEWSAITVVTSGTGNPQTYNKQLLKCTVFCTDGVYSVDTDYDTTAYTGTYTPVSSAPLAWTVNGTTLELVGWGITPDFEAGKAPWAESAASLTAVTIDKYITGIGANAFAGCQPLSCSYAGSFEKLKTNSKTEGNGALFGEEPGEEPEPDPTEEPTEAPDTNIITGKTGDVTYTLDKTTGVMTLSGEGGTKNYTSLDEFNGDTDWNALLPQIQELVVEEGVTALGNRLFTKATAMKKVTLPASLESIGARCFTDCYALAEVTFPETGELALKTMSEVAFNCCTSLTSIDLSRTQLETLTRKAFAACSSLETIHLPATLKTIVNECFGDTAINKVNTTTGKLRTVYFGGTLEAWEAIGILDTTANPNLTNGTCTVYCADGGIWNAKYTSMDNLCYKIENGVLAVRGTGDMADYPAGGAPWYSSASDITTVIFEDGITSIGANAMNGCVNLVNAQLCAGIAKVGENAFADCEELELVNFYGTAAQWTALQQTSAAGNDPLFDAVMTSGYSGICGDDAIWIYDEETKTLTISGTGPMWDYHQGNYETGTPWNKFKGEIEKIVIDYGITNTGRYAFCHMGALKELEFVTNDEGFTTVETIGGYCFCWNETLEVLRLPEGVRFLSGRAFSRVESVHTVYLPSTLESVDMYCFKSEDPTVTISKVYYNGTREDWARVYVSSQGDNDKFLLPDADTEWVYLKEYDYYEDVPADSTTWYKDAVYYLKDHGMVSDSDAFGVDETATADWTLHALYVRSGASGAYVDALDWAKVKNIVAKDTAATGEISMNALADILHRTTLYNGHIADLGDGSALDWGKAQGYIPQELAEQAADAALTRAQTAAVLAAYLQDDFSSADRYEEMRSAMKTAYKACGDGKMYVLALHHAGSGKVGDSTLILMPGGELMLIDTFRSDGWTKYLKATLDTLGATNLDYLVLSHGHEDHDANLSNVIKYIYDNGYSIGNYWSAGDTTSSREKAAIELLEAKGNVNIQKKLRSGTQLTIGSGSNAVIADILWPTSKGASGDGNNGSLTMKLTYGKSSYLTGGDLFLDGEFAILDHYQNNLDALKADVMKTNHHGSYSSNGSEWVAAIDPLALITHSDDSGDSAQCYEYSRDGKAWFSAGRDGGVLVVMDSKKNITVTTGYDTNLRQDIYFCGEKGHSYENQEWEYDENGHWRRCAGFWLCGSMESVQIHAGGKATCQHGKICEICGFEYTEKGGHDWTYSGDGNVITATCGSCQATGTLTLSAAEEAPIYDGTEKTVTVENTIEGMKTPEVVYEGSRVNAGTFAASVEVEGAKAVLEVSIGKRNVAITANDQTIIYGGNISDEAFVCEGLLEGHSAAVTLTAGTVNVTADGTITAAATIADADDKDVTANYEITYGNGVLVIEPDTSEIDGLTVDNVTAEDKAAIETVLAMMEAADSVKPEWASIMDICKTLLDAIPGADAVAKIGDAEYTSLSEAITAAEEGATIKLVADAQEESVVMVKGNTLDLNGNTLEVSSFVAIYGDTKNHNHNKIVDSKGGGLLKVRRNRILIQARNEQLPIWNEENQGYVFVKCPRFDKQTDSVENGKKYTFLPYLDISAYELLARGAASSGVTMKLRVTWSRRGDGMPAGSTFIYTDQLMKEFVDRYDAEEGKFKSAFILTLTGTSAVDNLQFQVFFASDTGVEYQCQ